MSKTKIFCFGFGQVAESFINKLINEKKDFDLSVTSRQETHQIEFNHIKINSYQFGIGYSGWGPGQLDREINEESWWLGPLDESILIGLEYELRWEKTMEKLRTT